MTIRAKLLTAIVVAVAGLALTAGVGIWGMSRLGTKFDSVREAGEARALALELKYDITDFNGWQTAYGYDNGASRPIFLSSVVQFRVDLSTAKRELRSMRRNWRRIPVLVSRHFYRPRFGRDRFRARCFFRQRIAR